MISQETAARLWNCYREIAAGEQLLADLKSAGEEFWDDIRHKTLTDAFGRRRKLQLGVPSGDSSHRLLDVAPALAESVIRAHIANKRAELAEANEQARIELGDVPIAPDTEAHEPRVLGRN